MKTTYISLIFLAAGIFSSCSKESAPQYSTEKVEKQNLSITITATGTIEPVTKVEVGTQVSGIISKIFVDYNSIVHKGQVIAELDKTNYCCPLKLRHSRMRICMHM